jgi:hypothetical protein
VVEHAYFHTTYHYDIRLSIPSPLWTHPHATHRKFCLYVLSAGCMQLISTQPDPSRTPPQHLSYAQEQSNKAQQHYLELIAIPLPSWAMLGPSQSQTHLQSRHRHCCHRWETARERQQEPCQATHIEGSSRSCDASRARGLGRLQH